VHSRRDVNETPPDNKRGIRAFLGFGGLLAALVVVAATIPTAASAYWTRPPNTSGSTEGTAIAHRLTAAGDSVTYNTSGEGPKPQASFCTQAIYISHGGVFDFCAAIYANPPTAQAAYSRDLTFVQEDGTPDANQFYVLGPTVFWGFTGGGLNGGGAPPPLPRAPFHKVASIALGKHLTR